jgi:Type II secretion system (T2SS), protein G
MRILPIVLLLFFCGCDGSSPADVVPIGVSVINKARLLRVRKEIQGYEAEISQHLRIRGEWPEDWGFLRRSAADPWGTDYGFEIEGERPVVYSAGPDREYGTEDDIHAP